MIKKRVVITGIGAVTPLGNSIEETWDKVKNGISGVTPISLPDRDKIAAKVAGESNHFNPEDFIDKKEARRMDRFTQFAVAAAKMAVADSKLEITDELAPHVGVWIGSGIGGIATFEDQFRTFTEKGARRVSPFFIPMLIPDMASGQVSIAVGAKGPNGCTVTACASGANSIGDAFKIVQRGDATAMVAGGTEAPLTSMAFAGFGAAKALSLNPDPKTACRPFDLNRDGFIMSEGSAIIVIEELEHALARGAHIYAELVGYGATGDAYHMTAPAPGGEGGARAMACALKDAELTPEDIDYINAHGTSTNLNDKYETAAIKEVFGSHAYNVAISSTKSMTGHLMGAAGAIEAIFSALAIEEGLIPPTINYETPDPECDLDYVPNEARRQEVRAVLSNSLGFGGHNASLVFKKYQ